MVDGCGGFWKFELKPGEIKAHMDVGNPLFGDALSRAIQDLAMKCMRDEHRLILEGSGNQTLLDLRQTIDEILLKRGRITPPKG